MPPVYKPLTSAGGLTGAPGVPAEIFNEQALSLEDYERQNAQLRAQELANQSNEITVSQRQRAADQEAQLREALQSQYGGQDQSSFDPDAALQTAQRIALQSGDLDTALNIERITKERQQGTAPLTPQQRQLFEQQTGEALPEGITVRDLTTLAGLQKANTYAQQVGIYANDPNRELRAQRLAKELTGEQLRPLNADQVNTLNELESFSGFVDNVKQRYLPYISENRAERFLAASVNPNSAAARLKSELDLVATQLAAAYNGKRLSDLDFQTMSKLVQVSDLDTMETVVDRLDRLKEFTDFRKGNFVETLGKGNFNVSNFRIPRVSAGGAGTAETPSAVAPVIPGAGQTPPLANYGVPRNPDGSKLTKEQFMALRNRGQ